MDETPVVLEQPDFSNKGEFTKTPKPKAMDLSKLKQKPVDKSAVRAKTKAKPKVPVYREPPRGQMSGPIRNGPADLVICSTCSRLFSTKENPVRYGVRKRHAKRHLADHRMGRIKRPVEAE